MLYSLWRESGSPHRSPRASLASSGAQGQESVQQTLVVGGAHAKGRVGEQVLDEEASHHAVPDGHVEEAVVGHELQASGRISAARRSAMLRIREVIELRMD